MLRFLATGPLKLPESRSQRPADYFLWCFTCATKIWINPDRLHRFWMFVSCSQRDVSVWKRLQWHEVFGIAECQVPLSRTEVAQDPDLKKYLEAVTGRHSSFAMSWLLCRPQQKVAKLCSLTDHLSWSYSFPLQWLSCALWNLRILLWTCLEISEGAPAAGWGRMV